MDLLSEDQILKIAKEYINNKKLKRYVKEIKLLNEFDIIGDTDFMAAYENYERKIYYNYQLILKQKNNNEDANFMLLYGMYHELIHAMQYKIQNSFFNSKEKTIFHDDFYITSQYNHYYMTNRDAFPSEHNAILLGYLNALKMMPKQEYTKYFFDQFRNYYNNEKYSKLYFLYNDFKLRDKYFELSNSSNDDFDKSLLGLQISEKFYNEIKSNDKKLLNKFMTMI